MKISNMCPFEKNEKEVFFRLTFFFQEKKKFVQGTTFVQFFMYYSHIWPPPVAIFLALRVWEGTGAIQGDKYLKW